MARDQFDQDIDTAKNQIAPGINANIEASSTLETLATEDQNIKEQNGCNPTALQIPRACRRGRILSKLAIPHSATSPPEVRSRGRIPKAISQVGEVIVCDVYGMAWLSHSPPLRVRTHKMPLDSKLSGEDITQRLRETNASDFLRNHY